jgi:uncharacterized protein (UPF0332 family)
MNWQLEFERCLDKRWLVRMSEARYLVTKELKVALDDLAEAEGGYERGGYKWSTVQSYYAMFHAARALLYSRAYREKSHYCLSVAMRHLFVSQGVLDERLIDDMDDARALREDADYRAEFSAAGARHNLNAARRLVDRVSELLAEWEAQPGDQSTPDSTPLG